MDQQNTTQPTQPTPPIPPVAAAAPQPEPAPTPTPPTSSPPPSPSIPSQPPTPPTLQPPHEEHKVSIRTVLLIVVLAILAAVLLFIALKPMQKNSTKPAAVTPTTKPSQAHSTLTLTLADTTATPSSNQITTTSVNVVLDTQSNKVSGVQFEISYDPTILTNVKVTPGDFFNNPLVLLNQVDTKNGKINYAVGIQPTADQMTGTGTVAVISYTLLPTATTSLTTLHFLPKTQVVAQGVVGSVLEKALDVSIPISGLTPAAGSASPQAQ